MRMKLQQAVLALAIVATPVLFASTSVKAGDGHHDHDRDIDSRVRYYLVRDDVTGACFISRSHRIGAVGKYNSFFAADRARNVRKSIGAC